MRFQSESHLSIVSGRYFETRQGYLSYLRKRRKYRIDAARLTARRKKHLDMLTSKIFDLGSFAEIQDFLNENVDILNIIFDHHYCITSISITSVVQKNVGNYSSQRPRTPTDEHSMRGWRYNIKINLKSPDESKKIIIRKNYDLDFDFRFEYRHLDISDVFGKLGIHTGGGGGNYHHSLSYTSESFAADFDFMNMMEVLSA